ncbi:hypothetical protein BWI93_13195 [Siphonobacter sp. BAB-5385]|nr:hypothetical protein BWI93_13195 [Siphonobacter sp. BAB-5385]
MKLNRNRKRVALGLFAVFHLTVILLTSFLSDYSTAKDYLSETETVKGSKIEKDLIQKSIYKVLELPGITPYTVISGVDAGYGFFAPNVASSYIVECVMKDKNGKVIDRKYSPALQTNEGTLRYETLISGFQERMKAIKKKNTTTLYTRFLDIVLKSIGHNMLNTCKSPELHEGQVNLYLYSYPMLDKYIVGNREAKLIKIVGFDLKKESNKLAMN